MRSQLTMKKTYESLMKQIKHSDFLNQVVINVINNRWEETMVFIFGLFTSII